MPEPRDPELLYYPKATLIWSAVLIFLLGLRSRRQFRFESGGPWFAANLNRLAGTAVETAPHDDTIAYYLERVDPEHLRRWPGRIVRHLIRGKVLDRWRLYGRFLVAIDGTGPLSFRQRHCEHCLTRQTAGGRALYFHHVREAKRVTAGGLAFSLTAEFIENADPQADRQGCELKAFTRLAQTLQHDWPQLPICLLDGALYANAGLLAICRRNRWDYIFTFKPGRLPERFAEFQTIRRLSPHNRAGYRDDGRRQRFAWVDGLDHQGHRFSAFDCQELTAGGSGYFAWITSLTVGCRSVITLANQGGRLRWKIENEGFNIQKRHGYELEHAYSQHPWAAKNFYFLLQVAHAINQLMIRGSLIADFDQTFGSVRNFLRRLAEALRNVPIDTRRVGPEADPYQIRLDSS